MFSLCFHHFNKSFCCHYTQGEVEVFTFYQSDSVVVLNGVSYPVEAVKDCHVPEIISPAGFLFASLVRLYPCLQTRGAATIDFRPGVVVLFNLTYMRMVSSHCDKKIKNIRDFPKLLYRRFWLNETFSDVTLYRITFLKFPFKCLYA